MSIESYHLDLVHLSGEDDQFDARLSELPEQYELLRKLNEGGMGSIFEARNRYTGSRAAIKVLRLASARNRKAVQRFVFEAKSAGALKHPHICQVYDFGITKSGMPYLIMDWIDGISLQEKVKQAGTLSANEAVPIFQQVALALAYAHKNKVVHRDIKPENIMLSQNESGRIEVRIVDFGIAKTLSDAENGTETLGLTKTGMVMGTPLYMSPEQVTLAKVDARTDIYSLGCVMYFTLTGSTPFYGETVIDIFTKHVSDAPPEFSRALKIPNDLRMITLKAMEKDPEDRYPSMELLALDLKKLTKGVTIQRHVLTKERKSLQQKLMLVSCFILAYLAVYNLSLWLQVMLDSSNSGNGGKNAAVQQK
jgi:eukaryotic-like serine/threonine-protein kinase